VCFHFWPLKTSAITSFSKKLIFNSSFWLNFAWEKKEKEKTLQGTMGSLSLSLSLSLSVSVISQLQSICFHDANN
jgi:hypothetical protein